MRPIVFLMITTKKSDHYTDLAISSFFRFTKLKPNDVFYLVDNDQIVTTQRPNVTVIVNEQPKSFAKNINDIINIAEGRDIDPLCPFFCLCFPAASDREVCNRIPVRCYTGFRCFPKSTDKTARV